MSANEGDAKRSETRLRLLDLILLLRSIWESNQEKGCFGDSLVLFFEFVLRSSSEDPAFYCGKKRRCVCDFNRNCSSRILVGVPPKIPAQVPLRISVSSTASSCKRIFIGASPPGTSMVVWLRVPVWNSSENPIRRPPGICVWVPLWRISVGIPQRVSVGVLPRISV